MNKIKNLLKYVLLLLLIITPFSFNLVKADSGWDSSYDSGGSSWDSGGSSWSSSDWDDDWDSDYSSGSSYSSSGGDLSIGTLFTIIMVVIIIILISSLSTKSSKRTNNYVPLIQNYIDNYQEISEEQLKDLLPDMTLAQLRTMAYEKFLAIQNAWMEFEYDKLRELCTDELYNSYVAQLDVLKLKNGKNVMSDFKFNGTKIINVSEADGNVTITVFMNVSFYDYVINTLTNKVTRGNSTIKTTNNYVMTFVRKQNVSTNTIKCPNCGATNNMVTSGRCEYCGSTLVSDANDFVLSKKTNVNK